MTLTARPGRAAGQATSPFTGRLAELIWSRSLTRADHPYLEHARTGRSLSFAELRRASDRWAVLLEDLAVGVGQAVGIAVSDPVDFATVFLSTIAAGRLVAPLDPWATDRELVATCARVRPALVIADRPPPPDPPFDWLTLPTGSFELPEPEWAWSFRPSPPSLSRRAASDGPGRRGGLVLTTSGTTGTPKLIGLSEVQLLHTAGCIASHHQLSAIDRGFNPLPLFHINAEVVGLLATLVAGATLVADDRFHRRGFWELMEERRVTWINAVPVIVSRLVPLSGSEAVPSRLRYLRSASAPLPAATLARFEQETGLPVLETYGMTEAGSQITANPLGGPRRPGSVGLPVGVELRVVRGAPDEAGSSHRVTPGLVGRVEIRGPGVITAYAGAGYEDRIDTDGWLDTGDLGRLDESGYLYLVGRSDDVINRGGEKIFPREVEEVVLTEPDVVAATVVGWDHHELGRVPVAYLVVHGVRGAGDRDRAVEIVGRVHQRCVHALSRSKWPVAFHVVSQLPTGATGKVRRNMIDPAMTIYSLLVS